MKKFLILLFMCLSLQSMAFAKNVKFIQITDVHYTPETKQNLVDFVQDVNKNYKDIDFVVFTGDNIDKANPQDLIAFLNVVNKINKRVYILPGNHDLYKNQKMTSLNYMKYVRKKMGFYHSKKPNYVFKKDGVVFVVMNGVKEVIPGPGGYFKQEELDWLDKTLTKYADNKVIIFQHFPLLEAKSKSANLYRKEDYIDVLKMHPNVLSVISGHYHSNREEFDNGIYHIITSKFNNRYYKLIEVDIENDFVFTNLIDTKADSIE